VGESIVLIEEYTDRSGELRAVMTSFFLPGIKIEGHMEYFPDGFEFTVTGASLFSNWSNGWTEAHYEASGIYTFQADDRSPGTFECEETDSFALWDITHGEVRYKDAFYRGNDGIWKVKNRIDRIQEISRWLKNSSRFSAIYGDFNKETLYSFAFRNDMEVFLFPELRNFDRLAKRAELPEEYYQFKEANDRENRDSYKKIKGNGINWVSDYTVAVFPEEFHDLRNSGTILRDFEEAPLIFMSFYNIDSFFRNMVKDQKFTGDIK